MTPTHFLRSEHSIAESSVRCGAKVNTNFSFLAILIHATESSLRAELESTTPSAKREAREF